MTLLNMNQRISIVIPVYNHSSALERSFDTLIRQTYRPLEVIIVDDGSTDNLENALLSFRTKREISGSIDHRTEISPAVEMTVLHQDNRGASAARNRGFAEATGEFVIFWDADTLARPEMLERLKRLLDERPEASYAYSRYKFGWKTMKSQEFNAEDLKKYNYIDTTSLVRSSVFSPPFRGRTQEGVYGGPFDESLQRFQDWDLWLTLLEQNKTGVFAPEVLFKKMVGDRIGISKWIPSLFFKLPWKTKAVIEYEESAKLVQKKHALWKQV